MSERLGVFDKQLFRIIPSSSTTDETMFPIEEGVAAKMGPSEDAEDIIIIPGGLEFSGLQDTGDGFYVVDIKPKGSGSKEPLRTIYIAKP